MYDYLLAGFSLVPLGLLLFFWKVFPRDHGIHPIYRESGVKTIDERTEIHGAAARRAPMREVERNGKAA